MKTRRRRPQNNVTTNKAELLDATSGATLCDGKLTALNNGTLRVACSGTGPYEGVSMVLASRVDAGARRHAQRRAYRHDGALIGIARLPRARYNPGRPPETAESGCDLRRRPVAAG